MPVSGMKYASVSARSDRTGPVAAAPGHAATVGRRTSTREQDRRGGMHLSPLSGGFRDAYATLSVNAER